MYLLVLIIEESWKNDFIHTCILRASIFYISLIGWTRYSEVTYAYSRTHNVRERAHNTYTHWIYNTGWMPNAEDWWRRQGRREWSNDPKSRPCWLMGIISKSGDNYFWKIKNSTIVINYSKCNAPRASGRNRITLKTNNNSSHDRSDIGCTQSACLNNVICTYVNRISLFRYIIHFVLLLLSKVLSCYLLIPFPLQSYNNIVS